jgi:hypothetical protein
MKIQLRKTGALLMTFALIFSQGIPVDAQENSTTIEQETETSEDIVFTEGELADWMSTHKYIGGTVRLGGHITISELIWVYADESSQISIDTGVFGLVYNGGSLYGDYEFFHIFGEGVDMPVVEVLDMGYYRMGNENNDLIHLNVTANGREGEGGTALRIRKTGTSGLNLSALNCTQGTIRSYGTNAIGLWLDVSIDAYCYRIEVSGDNSTAVYAPEGASLYYCRLTAEGQGARSVTGADVLVDTCQASPEPDDMNVVNRTLIDSSMNRLYVPVKQNGILEPGTLRMRNTPALLFGGGEGVLPETRYFYVNWDFDTYFGINTDILGRAEITGTTDTIFSGLGLFDDATISMTVDVRDPALPCISMVNIVEYDGERHVHMPLWDEYDPGDEKVILWRSDDEGQTWWKATHSPDIKWERGMINFTCSSLENPVWFQVEITGTGESNIAVVYEKNGISYGGSGGDRTGTDRNVIKAPGSNEPDKPDGTEKPDDSDAENPEVVKQPDGNTDTETPPQTSPGKVPDNTLPAKETEIPPIDSIPLMPLPGSLPTQPDETTVDTSSEKAFFVDENITSQETNTTAINAIPLAQPSSADLRISNDVSSARSVPQSSSPASDEQVEASLDSGQQTPPPANTLPAVIGLLCTSAAVSVVLLVLKYGKTRR